MTATDMDRVARALALTGQDFPDASRPTGVLVASRHLQTRLMMAHFLEGLGYDVWTAGSSADAYEVGSVHPLGIDAIVCDASLSDTAVSDLYGRLKARHPGLRCYVLNSTGPGEPEAVNAARLGAVVVPVGE